jgi:glycosyltransferase involved in cell wall biosynthesis
MSKVKLRVGIVTDQYPSIRTPDRGTFVRELAGNLLSAGVEVTVVNHKTNFAAMSLECLIRSRRLDILDAQFIAPAGIVAALTPRAAPLVITVHRWDILEFPYRWPMARIATIAALRSTQGIVAVGHTIMSEVKKFVTANARAVTLPNAVDTQKFSPDVEHSFIKQRLGIPENYRVILSVGHLVPRKGFPYLLRAMKSVLEQFESCSLVIVGGGHLHGELESLGHKLGLGDRVKLTGVVKECELPAFYAMADVFVMPSLSEGHCVAILEAMSAAKPVIASSIAANAETIVHGQNGFLVPARDSATLADAILRLLQDDALRQYFGRNSRERAIREFGWDLRARRLIDFYESILQSSHSRA